MSQIEVTPIDSMGSDLTVVNAARVSFGKSSGWESEAKCPTDPHTGGKIPPYQRLSRRDQGLIWYLASHDHISPFGHCFASFHTKVPIFVARQLVKHEYLRINEISRRYVDDPPEFYTPPIWRGRAKDKKQGSEGEIGNIGIDWTPSFDAYHDLLDRGVCPEQARIVLPQSTMTEFYWSGSLDAFAKMCKLRLSEDTQYESRLVAQQVSEFMGQTFPVSWEALLHEG